MELLLKNVDPKDLQLLKGLSKHLGIKVGTKTEQIVEKPDNATVAEDLKEAIEEIKLARAGKIKLQGARDLIDKL